MRESKMKAITIGSMDFQSKVFSEGMAKILPFISQDESFRLLNGVNFRFTPQEVIWSCTDITRFASFHLPLGVGPEFTVEDFEFEFNFSKEDIEKILSATKNTEKFTITFQENTIGQTYFVASIHTENEIIIARDAGFSRVKFPKESDLVREEFFATCCKDSMIESLKYIEDEVIQAEVVQNELHFNDQVAIPLFISSHQNDIRFIVKKSFCLQSLSSIYGRVLSLTKGLDSFSPVCLSDTSSFISDEGVGITTILAPMVTKNNH